MFPPTVEFMVYMVWQTMRQVSYVYVGHQRALLGMYEEPFIIHFTQWQNVAINIVDAKPTHIRFGGSSGFRVVYFVFANQISFDVKYIVYLVVMISIGAQY